MDPDLQKQIEKRHRREQEQRAAERAEWEKFERRKDKANNARWVITFVIWGVGVAFLLWLWELQKAVPGTLGDILAFAIQFVAFWYFLALMVIRSWVGRWLGDNPLRPLS